MKRIADLATTDPMITCRPDDMVTMAADLMKQHSVGDVMVCDGEQPIGILTDRDITVRVLAEGLAAAETTCGDVCSTDLVTIDKDADTREAVKLMTDKAIRRLPVLGDDGQLFGMVTLGDLAEALDDDSALADISEAPANS